MISDPSSAADSVRTDASPSRSFRSLKLAWTDADSGQQFIVSLRGGAQMLGGLQQAGFELLDEPSPTSHKPAASGAGESGRRAAVR